LVSPLRCNEFALFKSVGPINRFKKQHFLNRFEQNNDLKSAPKGRVQKIQRCKGRVKRKKITGGKNKTHPHYMGYQPIYPIYN
jgi:hypothetical protein